MGNDIQTSHLILLAFQSILENSPDMIYIKDKNLVYVASSQSFADIMGINDIQGLPGKTDFDFFSDHLARKYIRDDQNVINSGFPICDYIEPLPDKEGKKRYCSTSKFALKDAQGNVIGLYGISRDITAQMELEEERETKKQSRQMFEGVLEADITNDVILRADGKIWNDTLAVENNASFSKAMVALSKRFIHEKYSDKFENFYAIDALLKHFSLGKNELAHITYLDSDGNGYRWIELKTQIYYSKLTNTIRLTTVLNDLDEVMKDKEQLKIRAETDSLTGLLNRQSTMEHIEQCIEGFGSSQFHTLLFIDLDGFKQINDTMGHYFGDKVLQSVAKQLSITFSSADIIGRIGGDEFLILIQDVGSKANAYVKANALFSAIPFFMEEDGHTVQITCSVGAAMYDGSGKTMEQLYIEADKAMYKAKRSGKNKIVFY